MSNVQNYLIVQICPCSPNILEFLRKIGWYGWWYYFLLFYYFRFLCRFMHCILLSISYLLTATIEYLTISFWFPSKILIQVKNCILYDFDFQVAEQSCIQICQRKIDSKLLPWDFLHNFLPEDPKIKLAPRPFMEKYTWMSGDAWSIYRLAHTNL